MVVQERYPVWTFPVGPGDNVYTTNIKKRNSMLSGLTYTSGMYTTNHKPDPGVLRSYTYFEGGERYLS